MPVDHRLTDPETTTPTVKIIVQRRLNGVVLEIARAVSVYEFIHARDPGPKVVNEIQEMLRSVRFPEIT